MNPNRTVRPPGETNQTAEMRVEKWVYGGDALGRIDGRVALVPFVLPGELVRIEIEREKPGLVQARPVEILEAAAERILALCPYFSRCGGCQYQHAPYEFQVEQKILILQDTLRRVGKFEPPEDIGVVAGHPWEYRNRSQFHIHGREIGYLERGSHRLCAVERCPISSPKINEALRALWEMLADRRFPRFVRSIELFTNQDQVQLNVRETERGVAREFFDWAAERIPGAAAGALDYTAAGQTYRVGHRSFFQVNRFLVDALVETAIEGAEGETALELYAGVGFFTLHLARRFKRVIAVESGGAAVRDLEFNAQRAGAPVEANQTTSELFLLGMQQTPDFVLADPPRAGLGKTVVKELLRLRPPRITVVACDPATLARDLAALTTGGYRLDRLTLLDLFPQTAHIETVVRLRRISEP